MPTRLYDRDDFVAEVIVFSEEGGGRRSPAFNGIRWDFGYADWKPNESIYMIWPDFFDEHNDSLPRDVGLPIGEPLIARFMIVNDHIRQIHQKRIRHGLEFFCHEGGKRVAKGTVTQITGLHEVRGD